MTQQDELTQKKSWSPQVWILGLLFFVSGVFGTAVVIKLLSGGASDVASNKTVTGQSALEQGEEPAENIASNTEKFDKYVEKTKSALGKDDLILAKELSLKAFAIAPSAGDEKVADALLKETKQRQKFTNMAVERKAESASKAFDAGDHELAKENCINGLREMKLATNLHLFRLLLAKIEGLDKDGHQGRGAKVDWVSITKKIRPSVVAIVCHFPERISGGTGFIVQGNLLATNHHVVTHEDKFSSDVHIRFADGTTEKAEECLYYDTKADIAILAIKTEREPLSFSTREAQIAQETAAFGFPLELNFTFSGGHVSGLYDGNELGMNADMVWIQHTAPINKGNSGGPLLNPQGQVIGMNTWRRTESSGSGDIQNINFAISADDIRNAIKKIHSQPSVKFQGHEVDGDRIDKFFDGLFD